MPRTEMMMLMRMLRPLFSLKRPIFLRAVTERAKMRMKTRSLMGAPSGVRMLFSRSCAWINGLGMIGGGGVP